MNGLEKALRDYALNHEGAACIPQFVGRLNQKGDISAYVGNLSDDKLNGTAPIFTMLQTPPGLTPVRLNLYWNPDGKYLSLDWDDADPERTPYGAEIVPQ